MPNFQVWVSETLAQQIQAFLTEKYPDKLLADAARQFWKETVEGKQSPFLETLFVCPMNTKIACKVRNLPCMSEAGFKCRNETCQRMIQERLKA